MNTVYSIEDIRDYVQTVKAAGKTVALVPTMGNLHDGHLTLVTKAKELADVVIVSIYVNQMQFGPNEDYQSYPRTMAQDEALLEEHNVDMVFAPTSHIIYPEGLDNHTEIKVEALDGMHCGKSRPNFFTGIATVVTKLFNIVQPDLAVFGEKDFQQLCIIRKMVKDLCLPVEIVGAPIARSETGLALSSRNGYLSEEELEQACLLSQELKKAKAAIEEGNANYDILQRDAIAHLAESGFQPDYFNIIRRSDLHTAGPNDKELIILAAAALGKARLIDNIQIDL
ncbi:pantoate--beta-alanine ligase [Sansalvadorimonas verongulae]|uniref:pantoate--beta-alanine ligase n=1 Tax=Sansalvadorimonas verongulae TaxID=2172824 RepID=UPI0012BC988A|nr:pantoate--beta-alanine ligase [Sansalvadorimonas verongulae]MTI13640.1 pantoate--beta-alanine ligase [Sansalvadorimonas verongulae]